MSYRTKLIAIILSTQLIGLVACSDETSKNPADNTKNNTRADMSGATDMPGTRSDMPGANADMPATGADMPATGADMPATSTDMPATNVDMGLFEVNDMGQVLCGDRACACSDGIDNDNNGLIDGFDPECTGPFDDDESSFATGIPGDNRDPVWQDCFFDGNSGSGDDKCRYHTGCLTGELPLTDSKCQLSQACLDFCKPRAPNGCDCFGCCEIYKDDGSSTKVIIGGDCTLEKLDDPNACTQCIPSTQCVNTCGECELCLGKTIDELPASCSPQPQADMGTPTGDMGSPTDDMGNPIDMGTPPPPGPINTCDNGAKACDANHRCASTEYCLQGCCVFIPL